MIYVDDAWYCTRCKELWIRESMKYVGRYGLLCPECVKKVTEYASSKEEE